MFHRRRKGKEFIHMYLYNYYIIFIWAVFVITSGLCEMPHNDKKQRLEKQQLSGQRKAIIQEAMQSNLLKLLNLKEVPKVPTNKAYVPVEMLREYMKYRDSVRDYIPDDREYLGKIDLDDLHPGDHNFWNELTNKYNHGIEIDMSTADDGGLDKFSRKFLSLADVTQAILPQSDPKEIDPRLEPILPPHKRDISSVHIKFNLSQESLTNPYGPEQLRGAVLKLNREKLIDCQQGKCDRRIQPTTDGQSGNLPSNGTDETNIATGHYIPFYQRLFINWVNGYDDDGTPRTTIVNSLRINTRDSTPISFDVSKVVKEWLRNPEKNYGIIVRVTNDDIEYDKLMKQSDQLTNASTTTDSRDMVFEHVRLKRGFRSTSDTEDSWLRQKPLLMIHLSSNDAARHNVKRADQLDTNMDGAQADAPDQSTDPMSQDESLTNPSSTTSQPDDESNKPTTKLRAKNQRPPPTANKRDGRQVDPSGRNPSSRSSTTQRPRNNKAQKLPKTEKCKLVPLTINFDEVGWSNWIIAPSSYSANFCQGDCSFPLADHQNSTNHAIIQAIFHSVGRNIPRTCCAPTKLGRMAILHQLDHAVQMKYYDDMIVESCGCL